MTPSEEIRKIWEEMQELKCYHERGFKQGDQFINERYDKLLWKFENVDTLFGHESTLIKAIIYYLDGSKRI